MKSSSVRFAESARVVSALAARLGVEAPVFRSPPRHPDADRTLKRRSDGECVVSVRVAGRPFAAVQADLIDGLVITNELVGEAAQGLRRHVWDALQQSGNLHEDESPLVAA